MSKFSVCFYGERVHCLVADHSFQSLEGGVRGFCYLDFEPDPFVSGDVPVVVEDKEEEETGDSEKA